MRIAIMGSGGVGGYFGARLAQAGNDVAFIARGRHLAAMRANGLAIRSVLGDMTIPRPAVTDDPAGLAPADIVLFAVKLWDTEGAAKAVLLCSPPAVSSFRSRTASRASSGSAPSSARTA
jgi:2-dehydropantoate 2-reductase